VFSEQTNKLSEASVQLALAIEFLKPIELDEVSVYRTSYAVESNAALVWVHRNYHFSPVISGN
jgi:hypothetical protein